MQTEANFKKVTFGTEFELFTLDQNGHMVNKAESLIRRAKKESPSLDITGECAENMIEIRSRPNEKIPNAALQMINDFEALLNCAEKEGVILYPYGTYPGSFEPKIRNKRQYKIKEKIFGKKRFLIAGRCIGMHCHYSLPDGVFDFRKKILDLFAPFGQKNVLVNMYNLFIAMDPAISTLAQSSPFYEGNFLGKDSRVIVYRGGKTLSYEEGLYADYPEFGELPAYKMTQFDLFEILRWQFELWQKIITAIDISFMVFPYSNSMLEPNWGPVKINPHGTMEQRGMDMNSPRIAVAAGTLVKAISTAVHHQFIETVPSKTAIKEPFKFEGNQILIPPHQYVRQVLQPKAAYKGLEDPQVHRYCTGLLKLGKKIMSKEQIARTEPFEAMLEKRKTVSDEIIETAKKLGIGPNTKMTNEEAALLAMTISKDLFKEVILTKQAIIGRE